MENNKKLTTEQQLEDCDKEYNDLINKKGDYAVWFKMAKEYSKEVLLAIKHLNNVKKVSLEDFTELQDKFDKSLNISIEHNPYINFNDSVSLVYRMEDFKNFIGKNETSKVNLKTFVDVYLSKIKDEEDALIVSPEDLLSLILEAEKKGKEMGKPKQTKANAIETEQVEDANNSLLESFGTEEQVAEVKANTKDIRLQGEDMKNENQKEPGTLTKVTIGIGSVALLAGAAYLGYWAFNKYFGTGESGETIA